MRRILHVSEEKSMKRSGQNQELLDKLISFEEELVVLERPAAYVSDNFLLHQYRTYDSLDIGLNGAFAWQVIRFQKKLSERQTKLPGALISSWKSRFVITPFFCAINKKKFQAKLFPHSCET